MARVVRREIRKRGVVGWITLSLFWIFNILMVLWLFSYWGDLAPEFEAGSEAEQTGTAIGATIGTGFIVFFWVAGAVILGLFAILTRGRKTIVEETDSKRGRDRRSPDASFHLGVAGEAQVNPDGVQRQDVIARLAEGDPVRFVREPENPHDEFAVRIDSRYGTIGYIPARNAPRLADDLDSGARYRARVDHIAGGGDKFLGVWLTVDLWFDE